MTDDDLIYLISGKGKIDLNDHNGYKFCPRCKTELQTSKLDHVIRPNCPNCKFVYYQNPTPAAGAVILEAGKILLVKRSIDPGKGDWCIPAGFCEWTEHPQQTAIREIKEETGLEIKITGLFDIFMGMDDPRTHAVLVLYLANIVGGELCAGDDADDAQYFAFESTPSNIAFQAHRDALQLYQDRYLGR